MFGQIIFLAADWTSQEKGLLSNKNNSIFFFNRPEGNKFAKIGSCWPNKNSSFIWKSIYTEWFYVFGQNVFSSCTTHYLPLRIFSPRLFKDKLSKFQGHTSHCIWRIIRSPGDVILFLHVLWDISRKKMSSKISSCYPLLDGTSEICDPSS